MMNALVKDGHSVTYLVLDEPPAGVLDSSVKISIIPFFIKARTGILFWAVFTLWLPIVVFFKALRTKPTVISIFGAYYSAASFFASRILKIPCVLFVRSLPFKIDEITKKESIVTAISRAYEKFGYKVANKVICMTEAQKSELEIFIGKPLAHYSLLPNDLPTIKMNTQIPKSPFIRIVTSGVLDKRKNVSLLIAAIKNLKTTDVELVIIGDGSQLMKLKEESKELPHVVFTGWQEDPLPLVSSSELYVHTSFHEGISNSLLEALACGIPVLASDTIETREILGSALLLFELNSPDSLTEKLSLFIKDPMPFKEASKKAGERLVFDWDSRLTQELQTTSNSA